MYINFFINILNYYIFIVIKLKYSMSFHTLLNINSIYILYLIYILLLKAMLIYFNIKN